MEKQELYTNFFSPPEFLYQYTLGTARLHPHRLDGPATGFRMAHDTIAYLFYVNDVLLCTLTIKNTKLTRTEINERLFDI
jgi:hypothetical protein